MVIKIQRSAASCRGPVGYNERKVASGEAQVIGVSNMDGNSLATVLRTFESYEHNPAISAKASNLAFHMTVNPGPGERMDDAKAMALVRDVMDGLGYSQQPFIVYRHDDTGREHYHIVSVRADRNGKIISNSHERRVLQRVMKDLGPRYGFAIGRKGPRSVHIDDRVPLKRFNPEEGEHLRQISDIFSSATRYCLTSRRQLEQVLFHFGVRLVSRNTPSGEQLMLQGLDRQGNHYGPVLRDKDLGMNIGLTVQDCIDRGHKEHRMKHREKERVRSTAGSCLNYSTSILHVQRMMEKKGITPLFSRDKDGQINGLTFIDHIGRCVFKCSDLGEGISATMFREIDNSQKQGVPISDRGHDEEEITSKFHDEDTPSAILDNLDSSTKSLERDIRKKRKRPKGITM